MAQSDRERWNRRYSERYAERRISWKPSSWLIEIQEKLEPPHAGARALDLACGIGRNSLWLAERGWSVDAWDLSDVALEILTRELCEREKRGAASIVQTRQVDLDRVEIPSSIYDLILNVQFLDRCLWPALASALRPGGLLVFETFVALRGGRESEVSPRHLLQPGELREAFETLGLEIVAYDETNERGTARLLARRPA